MAEARRILGRIASVQPAKRQVRIALRRGYRAAAEQLNTLELTLMDGESMRCRVASVNIDNDSNARVALVAGVTRDNVARMRGATVYAPGSKGPNRSEGIELEDVLGFAVCGLDGSNHGTVTGILETKAGGILKISGRSGDELLLPAVPEVITEIDWELKRVIVGDIGPYAVGKDEE